MMLFAVLIAAAVPKLCSKTDAEVEVKGEAKAEVKTAKAQIGGTVVAVGAHQVEVKLFKSGRAEALVYDARGELISDPSTVKLGLLVKLEGEGSSKIRLAYVPALARFAGSVEGTAGFAAAPADIELSVHGAAASAKLAAPILLVGPELGGEVVVAGDYGVELVADSKGSVEALVHTAAGAELEGVANLKLEAQLPTVGGELHAVALTWDAPKARFRGKVGADADLALNGAALVVLDGAIRAQFPRFALHGEAKHGGHVLVAGDYSLEVVTATGGSIELHVTGPSGKAHVGGDLDIALYLGTSRLKLKWDAPSFSYRAQALGNVDLALQPIRVAIQAGGKVHVGALVPKLRARASAKVGASVTAPKVDAKANANARAGVKVKAPSVSVKAPSVSVKAPSVKVKKKASAKASIGF